MKEINYLEKNRSKPLDLYLLTLYTFISCPSSLNGIVFNQYYQISTTYISFSFTTRFFLQHVKNCTGELFTPPGVTLMFFTKICHVMLPMLPIGIYYLY